MYGSSKECDRPELFDLENLHRRIDSKHLVDIGMQGAGDASEGLEKVKGMEATRVGKDDLRRASNNASERRTELMGK